MTVKTKIAAITVFGLLVVIAAYIARGQFGIGSEWLSIPVVGAAVIYLVPERKKYEK